MSLVLSIIIPMYNAEKLIEKTISSALNGVGDEIEVIVVDDGSTDNSYNICQKMNDKRVRVYKQKNQGAPFARNKGLKLSEAKYIMFFDADDFFAEGAVQKVLSEIKKAEHDCYIGNFYRYNGNFSKLEYKSLKWLSSTFDLYMFSPSPASKVFKKSVLLEKNLEYDNLKLAQDLNFYLKFLGITDDIIIIDYPFFHYRYVEKSISHVTDDRILDIGKSVNLAIDYYKQHKVKDECYSYAYLAGVRHTNYQLYKLIFTEDIKSIKKLFPQLKYIWDNFYSNANISPFNLRYYMKKWIDAGLQYNYRSRVERHLKHLEKTKEE